MKNSTSIKNQLAKFGLNPSDWVLQTTNENYIIFENALHRSLQLMATIQKAKINELQLIAI